MDYVKKVDIIRVNIQGQNREEDITVTEFPFTIFLNDNEFITLLCTPKSLENLAIGFLSSEGFISSLKDIANIKIDIEKGLGYVTIKNNSQLSEKIFGKRTITTGCGKGTIFYNAMDSFKTKKIENTMSINKEDIISLMKVFNENSETFKETGGVHSCALCTKDGIIVFEEDIGRHNALDKIIGWALKNEVDLKDKIILTSGRISSEILIKAGKKQIPVIVSRSAPTSLAVEMARELNILLIGFARGEKMNIYSNFPSFNP